MFLRFATNSDGYVLVKADRIEAISANDDSEETKQSTLTLKSGASMQVAMAPTEIMYSLERTLGLYYIVGFDLSGRTEVHPSLRKSTPQKRTPEKPP